jgi:fluoride ion exporter CrcB/FEX
MTSRLWAAVALAFVVPVVAGMLSVGDSMGKDEVREFSYLHSMVFDRDLDLANEYTALYPKFAANPWFVDGTHRPPNESPIGAALFWLPAYLFVVLARLDPSGLGVASRVSTIVVSSGMVSLAVLLAHDLVKRSGTRDAGIGVIAVAAGSFYGYWWLHPGLFSHGVAIGISTLYVWYWYRALGRQDARAWLVLGLLGGLVAVVRWQNVLLPLLSVPWMLAGMRSPRRAVVGLCAYGLGFLLTFAPQLVAWHAIYGEWFLVPQGQFMHWTKPYVIDVLFSPRYGLLGFSPILYMAVVGLLLSISSWKKPLVGLSVGYLLVSIYINGSAGDWYAGATFGPRRMDSLFPMLVVGSALFVAWLTDFLRRQPQVVPWGAVVISMMGTLVLGRAYRASEINVGMVGAHLFPYRAWEAVFRSVGWPPSFPAEVFYMANDGTRLGQYAALANDDPLTWLDGVVPPDARHLSSNWTVTGPTARLDHSTGTVFLYLMDLGFHYKDIGLRVDFSGALSGPLAINDRSIPGEVVGQSGHDLHYVATVPYDRWRPGLNRLTMSGERIELARVTLLKAAP